MLLICRMGRAAGDLIWCLIVAGEKEAKLWGHDESAARLRNSMGAVQREEGQRLWQCWYGERDTGVGDWASARKLQQLIARRRLLVCGHSASSIRSGKVAARHGIAD